MVTGRPKFSNREGVLADLLKLELSLDEIAMRHDISRRSVYVVAQENNLDMGLRTKLVRLTEEKQKIQNEITRLCSQYDQIGEDRS